MKKKIIKARLEGNENLAKTLEIEEKVDKLLRKESIDVKAEVEKGVETISNSLGILEERISKQKVTKSPACRLDDEEVNTCVARKIPELEDEGYSHEQAVAIAHSICSVPCSDKEVKTVKAEVDWDKMPQSEYPKKVEVKGITKINEILKRKLLDILKVDVQNESLPVRPVEVDDRGRVKDLKWKDILQVSITGGGPSIVGLKNSEDNRINPATAEKQDEIKTAIENIDLGDIELNAEAINLNTDELEGIGETTNTKLDEVIENQTDGTQKTGLVSSGEDVDVQHPLPVDGDSIYAKDIWVDESIFTDWSGNITDLVDNIHSVVTNTTADNPKYIRVHFNRTVYASSIGLGAYSGNFSNVKLELLGTGTTVRRTVDDSANNTKYTSNLYSFPPTAFNALDISFYTADTVSLSNLTARKEIATASRLQAIKPDGTVTDIDATTSGNLKISLEEFESQVSVNENTQLKTTVFESDGTEVDFENVNISAAKTVIDDCDSVTGWSGSTQTSNVALSNIRVQGTGAISFDKSGVTGTLGYIEKTISTKDISDYQTHAILHLQVYLSSITNIDRVFVRIGTDSSNYFEYETVNMAAGWNDIDVRITERDTQVGTGMNPASVTYVAVGVEAASNGTTLSGILVDNISTKRMLEVLSFGADAVDLATRVRLQDGNTGVLADIEQDATKKAIFVQSESMATSANQDPLARYELYATEYGATYNYIAKEDVDGNWFIQRETISTSIRDYATGTSDVATAWTNRASQSYGLFSAKF